MAEATKPAVPAETEKKNLAPVEKSMSVRFMEKVVSEFATGVGAIALTGHQQRLVQNYFVAVDMQLKLAEEKRAKKKSGQDPLPVTWANVNMEGLARSVIACARIGLDPAQKNHINMMPFKNNNTGKYDIVFIEGYRGIELKAVKYGIPHADDYGVLDGDEGTIKALVVPRRKQTESAVGQALSEMQKVGLIWRYFYKNKPYVQFVNFEEHQEGLHKRTAPKLPLYLVCRNDSEHFREIPGNSPLIEQNLIEQNRKEENSPKGYDYFSDFWERYPKKVAKADAVKAFAKLKMDNDLMKLVMAGLARAIKSDAWQKDDGKFIPYPATWINGRRWEDGK